MADHLHKIHWSHAAYHWERFGSPLRPCHEDIQVMEGAISKWGNRCAESPKTVLLWGVTPEIAGMNLPRDTELLAIDRSENMIRSVWPGDIAGVRRAVCNDWFNTPELLGTTAGVLICDGGFNTLSYPRDQRSLACIAHRALERKGLLIVRFLVKPDDGESPKSVFEELKSSRIGNFHAFKLRLAMALQEDTCSGIRMDDVWQVWRELDINIRDLAEMTGWDENVIGTIDLYRGKKAKLSFPNRAEVDAVFAGLFEELSRVFPSYELGERCPILVYQRGQ